MNFLTEKILRRLRRVLASRQEPPEFGGGLPVSLRGQEASDALRDRLLAPAPCMIARFGNIELHAVLTYWHQTQRSFAANAWGYVRGQLPVFWWDEQTKSRMSLNTGFFPATEKALDAFAERYLRDLGEIDVLGSWLHEENDLAEVLKPGLVVPLPDLEPYFHRVPWTRALENRTVLVIHPFAESIRRQYAQRTVLFPDPNLLPAFELKTLPAVQSIGGGAIGYGNWFEALDGMCREIEHTDFDVALIGAGAYGLPLAAHVKRLGKKAVHLGGATQILFGIRGRRWDDHPVIKRFYNEHWVRPLPEETPSRSQAVESGCYW